MKFMVSRVIIFVPIGEVNPASLASPHDNHPGGPNSA